VAKFKDGRRLTGMLEGRAVNPNVHFFCFDVASGRDQSPRLVFNSHNFGCEMTSRGLL
jgi:hypothetical protein